MISSMTPPVALVPELTSLPWLNSVSDQLGDPTTPCEELVGVDIGHINVPGLTASEVCAGFVMRNGDLQAATMLFTQREERSFSGIQKAVGASIVPSRMTHWALGSKRPQINTLIFRTFTLAYSFDFGLPAAEIPNSFRTRLVLHDAAATVLPNDLSRMMQTCLDSFSSAHDSLRGTRMLAPAASVLAQFVG